MICGLVGIKGVRGDVGEEGDKRKKGESRKGIRKGGCKFREVICVGG